MRMVEEGGLEALSVNKLAALVDYTPGALYRYFPSKAALVAALEARILADLRDRLVAAQGKASPLERVMRLVRAYATFAAESPARFGLLAATMAEPRIVLEDVKDAAPVAEAMTAALVPLATALADAEADGTLEPGDALERTICVFSLAQGVLLLKKQARYAPSVLDVERLLETGTRSLLAGWGAEAAGSKTKKKAGTRSMAAPTAAPRRKR